MLKNRADGLTLEKKLYQLIISRLDGYNIHSQDYKERTFNLIEKGIGGFIIFGGRRDEIKDFIQEIQSISEVPLFIASDIECGVGKQIEDATRFPCQMAMAAAIDKKDPGNIELLKDALKAVACESVDVGINMPLIPVLDVNQNPDNPIICTRAFSDNPEDVAWFGSWYIKELEDIGLISCAKHFPGHGDTNVDSHISLPVITKSLEGLMKIDLIPFAEAIKKGVSSIMVGHLSIPLIDSKPASLSKKIITDLLRKELGFDGLVLTDALNMKALKDFEYVSAECIKAGADILLHPGDADKTVEEFKLSVEKKIISEEEIEKTVNRILNIKDRLQNITKPLYPPLVRGELKGGKVDYQSHKVLSANITDMSITLLKGTEGLLPISDENGVNVILAGEDKFFEASPFKAIFRNVSAIPLPQAEGASGRVVFAIFTSVSAGKGTSGMDDKERKQICRHIKNAKTSVVISFGCPYVLRFFRDADVLIAAYETTEQAQKAVIKCLKGGLDFEGRLPVKI
jgi:beta-N-acetylhexosaminidase